MSAASAAGLERDAEARRRLRSDLGESFLVEAAAGTGKTTVLVERLVAVLAAGETGVERIVAVTFSRKAAGELKLRLRQQLDRARADAAPGSAERDDLRRAIARLEEAHIGTIHSFCAELLRRRPVEARVDPSFVEMDRDEAEQLYRRAFRRWIEERLEDTPPGVARMLRRLALRRSFDGSSPLERLRMAGQDLVDWRDFDAPWRLEDFDRDGAVDALVLSLSELAELRRRIVDGGAPRDPLAQELAPLADLIDFLRQVEEDAGRRDRDDLEARLLELLPELRRRPRRGGRAEVAPGLARRDVQAKRAAFLEQLEDFDRRAGADLAARLHRELGEVLERYDELKREAGKLDFLDLLIRCRDLLTESDEARRDFQRAFSHLFVDEFQDTDPLQAEILLLLSADDPAVTDWHRVVPRPGSLLLVGDPKQSIYRFRRADVVFYQGLQRRLRQAGVETLVLSRSFRAPRQLQAALNGAFGRWMREDTNAGQPPYVPLEGELDAAPGQPSLVALPVPRPFGAYGSPTGKAIEASLPEAVAAWIDWLLRKSGFTVRDPGGDGGRVAVRPRHVCVLFRRFQSWGRDVTAPYLRGLEARGVPHVLVGGRTLHQREEVETLRAALAAIEWPDDTLSVYATLRGAFFGFTDDLLYRYRTQVGRLDPFAGRRGEAGPESADELSDELRDVSEALDRLREWHRGRNERPIAETVHRLFEHSRAHAGFALRPAGHQVLANVQRVIDMARAFETRGGLSFRGFVESLDEAAAKPGSAVGPLVEEGAEGVRVMTVHSAKGLEFPIVVLADLSCSLASPNPSFHLDAERGLCGRRLLGLTPWELHEHRDLELGRDRAESVRLAYVAATRVRDLLVVPGLPTGPWRDGWLSPLDDAIYPAAGAAARPAAGCPEFGPSTSLVDPRAFGPSHGAPIQPGEHRSKAGEAVVWWDPSRLELGRATQVGVQHQHLLMPDEDGDAVEQGLDRYLDWERSREEAIEAGERPSLDTFTVTDTRQWPPEAIEVRHVAVERPAGRPAGRRFGTLVHAVLHGVDVGAADPRGEPSGGPTLRQLAELHGRLVRSPPGEVAAAEQAARSALAHPLLRRAADAERLMREVPFALRLEGGRMIEGVIDLAMREGGAWTVIDFKTDVGEASGGERLETYRRQIAWYVYALRRLTGEPAEGVLLGI